MQVQQVEFTFPSEKFLDEVKQPQFFERYRGRVIEITGEVGRVAKDDQGAFVTLQAGDDDARLRCYTISKAPGARVGRGMPIRIRGQVPADDRAPLKDCLFMEVSPGLEVAVPAVELAKEFAADFAAAKAKYRLGKYVVISGEIMKQDEDPSGMPRIELKGDDKAAISCILASRDEADAAASRLGVGKTIKIGGEFLIAVTADRISLSNCVPLPN